MAGLVRCDGARPSADIGLGSLWASLLQERILRLIEVADWLQGWPPGDFDHGGKIEKG
ncbi:hypothetical protein OHA72_14675 [Dactylosporangium sp. NBC_01737]|uniref:hypothetical protein n=1 Tax=Dactylosporangium sp. NBC_01737 TaxID=2975959 RepID=UPI002E0E93EA|nr:hypothetical protein OHA72_14675 [Dactylosporangium sp. NBC_01737]